MPQEENMKNNTKQLQQCVHLIRNKKDNTQTCRLASRGICSTELNKTEPANKKTESKEASKKQKRKGETGKNGKKGDRNKEKRNEEKGKWTREVSLLGRLPAPPSPPPPPPARLY